MPYTLTIPSAAISGDPKPYTVYHVAISTPLRTQTLQKRYSDFVTLHSALTSTLGAPPAPLPAKSWFTRTINNPQLTEDRRRGLQTYLQAIEESSDPKWKNSAEYRSFLGFSTPSANEGRPRRTSALEEEALGPGRPPSMSSQQWLDLHHDLKSHIHNARMALTRRDQATTASQQHEASAQAKKWLVKAQTLILRLEDGLRGLQEGRAGEKLGDGEIRRRRDLLGRARKEREGLEGVLSSFVTRSNNTSSPDFGQKATGGFPSDPTRSSANGMPGAFPTAATSTTSIFTGGGGGRRVLGGPPPKETDRTRELDNQQVLQLQQEIIQAQDNDVQDLSGVVRRMREMGIAINEELVEQGQLLDMLDQDVDRVGGKIDVAKKRIRRIN